MLRSKVKVRRDRGHTAELLPHAETLVSTVIVVSPKIIHLSRESASQLIIPKVYSLSLGRYSRPLVIPISLSCRYNERSRRDVANAPLELNNTSGPFS